MRMQPGVRFELDEGHEVLVGPGGIVGRLATAALCIDDPRISEAHAMVSLRGSALFLLALRGTLRVEGRAVPHVRLEPGVVVELVPGIDLTVLDRILPDHILGLDGVGGGPVALTRSVVSLLPGDPPRVEAGYIGEAEAWIWSADGLRWRRRGEEPRALRPGDRVEVAGHALSVTALPLEQGAVDPTLAPDRRGPALRIVGRYETLHVHREDGAVFTIGGIPARIVSELIAYAVPTPWEFIARTLWPEVDDRYVLRQNWDRHLKRLRRKLQDAGFRPNLVRSDGRGNVELLVMPGDEVVDES